MMYTESQLRDEVTEEREHCKRLCEQKIARLLTSLSDRIQHELNECGLCLTGEPNLPMAMDRLVNIHQALEREKERAGIPSL